MPLRTGERLNAFRPPVRRLRFWLLLFALWSVPASIGTFVVYIRMLQAGGVASWIAAAGSAAPFWYIWALLSPVVWWLGRRFPVEGRVVWLPIATHALLAVVIAAVHTVVTLIVVRSLFSSGTEPSLSSGLRALVDTSFPSEYLLYWAILGAGFLLDYHDRVRTGSVRTAQLEAQLAQAHLEALRVQLQPHFLFNTLHSISSLMDEDLETARRMLVRLGDLLRLTLETQSIHQVPLRQELESVEMYLDIERIRFPDQLDVEMLVEPEALEAIVPHLILQPLVENAIRYGVAPRQEGGKITICARCETNSVRLRVVDDGEGHARQGVQGGTGVGLANVRSRMAELYGPDQTLEVFEPDGGGFGVELRFPARGGRPEPVAVES